MSTAIQALVAEAQRVYPGVLRTTLLGRPGYNLRNGQIEEDLSDTYWKDLACRSIGLSVVGSDPKDGVYLVQARRDQ